MPTSASPIHFLSTWCGSIVLCIAPQMPLIEAVRPQPLWTLGHLSHIRAGSRGDTVSSPDLASDAHPAPAFSSASAAACLQRTGSRAAAHLDRNDTQIKQPVLAVFICRLGRCLCYALSGCCFFSRAVCFSLCALCPPAPVPLNTQARRGCAADSLPVCTACRGSDSSRL